MSRHLIKLFCITVVLLLFTAVLCACFEVEFKVDFMVDGDIYATVNTAGEKKIKIPDDPEKEGYTFDGWYWDNETWEKPFTANSLLNAPLSSNMKVYAKFTLIPPPHEHSYTESVTTPTCTEQGYTTHTCTCGDSYVDTYVDARGHNFTSYISDGNATYEADGTKTAVCDNIGCTDTDTKQDEGSMLIHTMYTVKHYQENADNSEYTLIETEELTGTLGYSVTPDTKSYIYFTAPQKQTITVNEDGSTVVNYYYTRNRYKLTVVGNGGASGTQNVKYGATINTSDITRTGFELGGLYTDVALSKAITKMPSKDVTVYAYWNGENKPSDFNYVVGTSTVTIEGYVGSRTDIIVPQQIGGKDVVTIDKLTFQNCTPLKSIIFPSTLKTIEEYAFSGCIGLTSITLPSSLTSIKDYAFSDCFRLVEVCNNSALTVTAGESGNGDVGLYALNVYSSNQGQSILHKTSDGYIFCLYEEKYHLIAYVGSKFDITLPSTYDGQVYEIYKYAFSGTRRFHSITVPSGITVIGEAAFYGCGALTKVVLPSGVTEIGDYMFYNCTVLADVTIPSTVKTIGTRAFYNCTALKSITLPSDALTTIGSYAFAYCTALESITVPNKVTTIGSYTFANCKKLNSITLSSTLDNIGSCAFYGCSELVSLTIPSTVNSIGFYAFSGCTKLTSITFSDTEEWYCTSSSEDWINKANGTQTAFDTPENSANYLKNTYRSCYWYKK